MQITWRSNMHTREGETEKMRYVDCRTSKQINIISSQRALHFEYTILALLQVTYIRIGNAANTYTTIACFNPGMASIPLGNTGLCLLRQGCSERVSKRRLYILYISLTVHLVKILVNNQVDALFQCIYLFHFSTCFEQPSALHQEN